MSRCPVPNDVEVPDDRIIDVLRSKTVAERIAMIADANDTARVIAAAGIRHYHPDWSEDQVQREVARRMLSAAD